METTLSGLKVLDFTRVYSGPYCTMLLADLGADVIKIEACKKGDDTRFFYPIKNGESGYFMYLNRNKKSLTLNLKSPKGKAIALALAKEADVLVENFSPGTMAGLGLDYEAVRAVNPSIVYASISGFGQNGPYRDKVAYDGVAQAMGGLVSLTGYPGSPPAKAGPAISDAASGIHAAFALMSALYRRQNTGQGQYIDVAMMDVVFSMLENAVSVKTLMGITQSRLGNANPSSAPYNMYRCKDGFIVIATANDNLFVKLTKVMGQPELFEDPRFNSNPNRKANETAIDAIVERWTLEHTAAELEKILDAAGVPVSPVKTIDQLVQDPHLKHRNMLVEIDHPAVGAVVYPGNPLKFSDTPVTTFNRAPLLGEHSAEILRSLGYTDEAVAALQAENII